MKITDFKINEKFFASGGFAWLCTDIGTRTITAIFLDPEKDDNWFVGPPYSVDEQVFDEHMIKTCYKSLQTMITDRVTKNNYHPGFHSEDVFKMFDELEIDEEKYNFLGHDCKILNREKISPDYRILHPYSREYIDDVWYVNVFDVFNHTYETVNEDIFVGYRFSTEDDVEKIYLLQKEHNEN